MAFITQSGDIPCYTCGKQCINVEFCSEGSSYGQTVSLSRNIRVSILANPEFWGFGGVLIDGWATYTNGYYDFFDGHDEEHQATKVCNDIVLGPFKNEQRPDVFFRSVYDPDTGISRHYGSAGAFEGSGIGRGGAEVYLIDRQKGLIESVSSDSSSCDNLNPTRVFKKVPENFGWGNKINFNTKIYKNLTGAWRLSSVENCYESNYLYDPPGYLVDCSGDPKQNIMYKDQKYAKYDPSIIRASGESNYYNYQEKCLPDGNIVGKYAGNFYSTASIYRNINESDFIQVKLSYGDNGQYPASGLKEGMYLNLFNEVSGQFNNTYKIFDVNQQLNYTSVKLVGTTESNPTGNFSLDIPLDSGRWIALNTYDYETCCGLAAYGLDYAPDNKQDFNAKNYHSDFRKVFNHPKNIRQSNRDREWRENYGIYNTIENILPDDSGRVDYSYVSVSGFNESGYPILVDENGDYVVSTGNNLINTRPLFEKQLPYYGNFFETDLYDDAKRLDQLIQRGKGDNKTCYTKHATLEIFPDCLTQYDYVEKNCEGLKEYVTNRVPRLAFVYRGCDFHDQCSFDDDKLPLGGWKDQGSVPTGINDLKRQLAGQEIHMFINLGRAWGGRKPESPCRCDCEDENAEEKNLPSHSFVDSPMTFTSFPNFDLNPSQYGCKDERYQAVKAIQLEGKSNNCYNRCDVLPSSDYACLPRQPYTTYGYIMNLCGKETRNRKDVIKNAFDQLHQSKIYTNDTPESDIDEPMYWAVEAPAPAPFSAGGIWGSGSDPRENGEGKFIQESGNKYGYWGLADQNNTVVAPYFATEEGYNVCCQETGYYVEYSTTGTWQNVLSTSNGWPTSKVPFLIEIEIDESCASACVSTVMNGSNLNLEIVGLDSEFIFDQNNKYGHNYCVYGSILEASKARLEPSFTCQDGFDLELCGNGDNIRAVYSNYYSENTCDCLESINATLYPIYLKDTTIVAGWTSNPNGGAEGLLELSGCWNSGSAFFDFAENQAVHRGYRVFAEFKLGCNNTHDILQTNPECPVEEVGDLVTNMWNGSRSCTHSYPAKIGSNNNFDLQTNLYFVTDPDVDIFRKFNEYALQYREFNSSKTNTPCLWSGDFTENGVFDVCDGDIVYGYGCYVSNPDDGPPGWFGCFEDPGIPCGEKTLCNTCSQYDAETSPNGINCVCIEEEGGVVISGIPVGWGGIVPRAMRPEWTNNICYCECSSPQLAAEYVASGGDLILTSGDPCRDIYWMQTENMEEPILLNHCGFNSSEGFGDKERNIPSIDYYEWSHGVNAIVSGIKYELYKPELGRETETNNFCEQMLKDMTQEGGFPSKSIIDCELSACSADTNVNSKTCGNPIYASGNFEGVEVRKKKCSPEIAIVTKIDCLDGEGYRLHISREYHEHDRTWYEKEVFEVDDNVFKKLCVPINVGSYDYNDGSYSGCYQMNYSLLADTVTPVSNPPCSVNPSSGTFVNQDYQYLDPGFPSGSLVWNYFNLFYTNGTSISVQNGTLNPSIGRNDKGVAECTGVPLPIANTGTVFTLGEYNSPAGYNGIFATNGKHSCVQDSTLCGGELWCNKMFFPRHSYKAGTKITRFGAYSVCTGNNEFKNLFDGDYIENGEYISSSKDLISEQKLRFVDFCNDSIIQTSAYDIGIDDDTIVVPDYLPLLGIVHPGWRFTSDVKSCTVASSGCESDIPSHTDSTIQQGIYGPKTLSQDGFDSMGYYLDSIGISYSSNGLIKASGQDQCLFNTFKILIDVECSLNRIQRKGAPLDSPTLLEGIQEWPAKSCRGTHSGPQCLCEDTSCSYNYGIKKGRCQEYALYGMVGSLVTGSYPNCAVAECNEAEYDEDTGELITPCSYGGGEQDGNYILPDIQEDDELYPFWALHPDNLVEPPVDLNGMIFIGDCCGEGDAICYDELFGNWMYNTCDGKYYRIDGYAGALTWQCKINEYLFAHPTDASVSEYCHCEQLNNSLCDAKIYCSGDFSSCECNPIPLYNIADHNPESSFTQEDIMEDCECKGMPLADLVECDSKSLIKWTITESI